MTTAISEAGLQSTLRRPDGGAGRVRRPGESSHAYALFQEPWWLDAVAPGRWDEVVVEQDRAIVARMPFMIKRKFGLTALTQPAFTFFLGPWFRALEGKYDRQLSRQKELVAELLSMLPAHHVFRARLAPELTNWLPFYWAGFDARPLYTYRIEDLSDEEVLWRNVNKDMRTTIRRAARKVAVRTDLGVDAMLDLQERTYERHGWRKPDRALFRRLDEACAARACRQVLVAEDAMGRRHAATYLVWDSRCTFAIGGGIDHELSRSGTAHLLRWESIRFASRVTTAFDFVGSMAEPVERAFRAVGARQLLSMHVSKMSRRMRAITAGREFADALFGRSLEKRRRILARA